MKKVIAVGVLAILMISSECIYSIWHHKLSFLNSQSDKWIASLIVLALSFELLRFCYLAYRCLHDKIDVKLDNKGEITLDEEALARSQSEQSSLENDHCYAKHKNS